MIHYHGIPSGFSGVILTFMYGIIMGFLVMYENGLLIAVLIHAINDYFIFTVIAKRIF